MTRTSTKRVICSKSIAALFISILSLTACTFLNKATFSIESSTNSDKLLNDIETYFDTLGLALERKVDFTYPERRKERSYFLGRRQGLMSLHNTYSYVVLRLEESNVLFIDWISISDTKQTPKPEYFEATNKKIADDLHRRFGVEVKFSFQTSQGLN